MLEKKYSYIVGFNIYESLAAPEPFYHYASNEQIYVPSLDQALLGLSLPWIFQPIVSVTLLCLISIFNLSSL